MRPITLEMLAIRLASVRNAIGNDQQPVTAVINGQEMDLAVTNFQIDDQGRLVLTLLEIYVVVVDGVLQPIKPGYSQAETTELGEAIERAKAIGENIACVYQIHGEQRGRIPGVETEMYTLMRLWRQVWPEVDPV